MQELNKYIEHTLLKTDATDLEIEKLAQEALENNFFGVCVNINFIEKIKKQLTGSDVKIVTVVNFPLANNTIDIIQYQTEIALKLGADEIDTVLNVSELKNKNYKKVVEDIKKTKDVCKDNNLKVIIETDLLTSEEIISACKCSIDGGANFVKTSTGFVKNGIGAKVEDVKLMYKTVKPYGLGVKASGGIKNKIQALELINAGALRLGTSSGVEIIKNS